MSYRLIITLLALVAAMLATAHQTCGDLDFRMPILVGCIWLGGFSLFVTIVFGFFRRLNDGWLAWRPAGLVITLIIIGMTTEHLSYLVLQWETRRAHAYPLLVEAQLDRFYQANNHYPDTLTELNPDTKPPRLIGYKGEQNDYSFGCANPGKIWGSWIYDRKKKRWYYND
jgi:hypothetical protein